MRKALLTCAVLLFGASLAMAQNVKVKTGIEVLKDTNFEILKGKKVGLVTNASGVDSRLKSTADILFEAPEVDVVALFGPEHGIRGTVEGGEKVENQKDEKTGLPVYSLYGKTRKPTKEMMEGLDAIIYDIQDIGCRSYTFISTMGVVMEAAAENGVEMIVLDRPNPLTGNKVEGCIVEDQYISFISKFKIPYVYGLTCGELAKMLNEEKMLTDGVKCNLTVVEMDGWKRDMTFEETGLPWVPTSPHIPHKDSPYYYVVSGIVGELRDVVSIGVGYTIPFQAFATEWIDAQNLTDKMNSYNLPGVIFRPIHYKPYYAFGKGTGLSGVQIHIVDFNKVELMKIQLYFLKAVHELYPDKNPLEMTKGHMSAFNKALGTTKIQEIMEESDYDMNKVEEYLDKDLKSFTSVSSKYFLYK